MCLQNVSHKRGSGKYPFPKHLPRFQQSTFQGILEAKAIFFKKKPLPIFSCRNLSNLHFILFVFSASLTFSDKKVLREKHKTRKMRNQEVRQLQQCVCVTPSPSFQRHQTPSQELTEMILCRQKKKVWFFFSFFFYWYGSD